MLEQGRTDRTKHRGELTTVHWMPTCRGLMFAYWNAKLNEVTRWGYINRSAASLSKKSARLLIEDSTGEVLRSGLRLANRAREKINPTVTSALNMMIDVNFKTMIHQRRLRSSAKGKAVGKWGIGKPRRGYDLNLGGVGEVDFREWHIRGTPDRQ